MFSTSSENNETNSNENLNDTQNLEQQTDFLEEEEDDEIRSTTEYTTNDEMDLESGSVSIPARAGPRTLPCPGATRHVAAKVLPTIQSKSIDDYLVQNLRKEEILAAKMSKFLSPTNWQLSSDAKRMIGQIVLKRSVSQQQQAGNHIKNSSSTSTIDSVGEASLCNSIGVKIMGGKHNPLTHQLSAYVIKVRKDSVAEALGRLQVGDEIVKWNGNLLRGLAYDEVYALMAQANQDAQVELCAERLMQ